MQMLTMKRNGKIIYKTYIVLHRGHEKFSKRHEFWKILHEYFEILHEFRAKLGPSRNPSVYRGFRGVGCRNREHDKMFTFEILVSS